MKTIVCLCFLFLFFFYSCSHRIEEKHPNGNIKSEGNMIDGKMQGEWMFYWENRNLKAQGKYIDGDCGNKGAWDIPANGRNGEWKFIYENGKVESVRQYLNGKETSGQYYRTNGEELGRKLEFLKGSGIVYYTERVGEIIARKFGDYLSKMNIVKSSKDSIHAAFFALDKTSNLYKVFIIIKEGIELERQDENSLKRSTLIFSKDVFDSSPVDICLCDKDFITKRTILFDVLK